MVPACGRQRTTCGSCRSSAELTRTPQCLRRVHTGYAYRPPALGTYRRRRAACPKGAAYCTYWVHLPASGVGHVPRTVAPQVLSSASVPAPTLSEPAATLETLELALGRGAYCAPKCTHVATRSPAPARMHAQVCSTNWSISTSTWTTRARTGSTQVFSASITGAQHRRGCGAHNCG